MVWIIVGSIVVGVVVYSVPPIIKGSEFDCKIPKCIRYDTVYRCPMIGRYFSSGTMLSSVDLLDIYLEYSYI